MRSPSSLRTHRVFAELVLFGITFIWGTTFVIIKDSLNEISPHTLVAWRFALGALLVTLGHLLSHGRTAEPVQWSAIALRSSLLGFFLFLGFETQTLGLRDTTATQSAFITGTVTIWVPLATWLFLRKRHGRDLWIAVPLGCIGLFMLTMSATDLSWESLAWGRGEFLTLLCAFSFTAHIICTQRWAPGIPTMALAMIQLAAVMVLSFLGAIISGEDLLPRATPQAWASVAYLALFPTAIVFWAQAKFQPLTTEERAAIIFLFEPVFAALVAWIVIKERLNLFQWIGAGLITLAAVAPGVKALFAQPSRPPTTETAES